MNCEPPPPYDEVEQAFLSIIAAADSSSSASTVVHQSQQQQIALHQGSTASVDGDGHQPTTAAAGTSRRTSRRSGGAKTGLRRHKANARERQRMHGLNDTLDNLRRRIPIISDSQKLSKIETLRLARNYIQLLDRMLTTTNNSQLQQKPINADQTATVLSRGVSQATSNVIASLLGVVNRSPTTAAVGPFILPQPATTIASDDINLLNSETCSNSSSVPAATTSEFRLTDLLAEFQSQPPLTSQDEEVQQQQQQQQSQTSSWDDAVAAGGSTYWSAEEFDAWQVPPSFTFDDPPINDPF